MSLNRPCTLNLKPMTVKTGSNSPSSDAGLDVVQGIRRLVGLRGGIIQLELSIHHLVLNRSLAGPANDRFRATGRCGLGEVSLQGLGAEMAAKQNCQHSRAAHQGKPRQQEPKPGLIAGCRPPGCIGLEGRAAAGEEVGAGLEHVQGAIRCSQVHRQGGLLDMAAGHEGEVPISMGLLVHVHLEEEVRVAVCLAQLALHVGFGQLLLARSLVPRGPDGAPVPVAVIEGSQDHRCLSQRLLATPVHVHSHLCGLCGVLTRLAEAEAPQMPGPVGLESHRGFELPRGLGKGVRTLPHRRLRQNRCKHPASLEEGCHVLVLGAGCLYQRRRNLS
mmetsp:Transcript_57560/g.107887  ORF Transcript_57560/g.107887 Transcript_57560/m.107887 type:complete len:331 (+) Transcript_57560:144-1136(+)